MSTNLGQDEDRGCVEPQGTAAADDEQGQWHLVLGLVLLVAGILGTKKWQVLLRSL